MLTKSIDSQRTTVGAVNRQSANTTELYFPQNLSVCRHDIKLCISQPRSLDYQVRRSSTASQPRLDLPPDLLCCVRGCCSIQRHGNGVGFGAENRWRSILRKLTKGTAAGPSTTVSGYMAHPESPRPHVLKAHLVVSKPNRRLSNMRPVPAGHRWCLRFSPFDPGRRSSREDS